MRAGIVIFGAIILILSAIFFYIPKVTATPADLGAIDADATLARYWTIGGMALGALIMVIAAFMPKKYVDPKRSPMREYPKTSAGQDDSGHDFFS